MRNFSNSKFIALCIAITLPTLALGDNVPPQYVLVPATVTLAGKPVQCLFRVETMTGQTWVYGVTTLPVPSASAGTNIPIDFPAWTPISEDLTASYTNTVARFQNTSSTVNMPAFKPAPK